jgi:hypothetical protein
MKLFESDSTRLKLGFRSSPPLLRTEPRVGVETGSVSTMPAGPDSHAASSATTPPPLDSLLLLLSSPRPPGEAAPGEVRLALLLPPMLLLRTPPLPGGWLPAPPP